MNIQIPIINREGSLVSRLIPVLLVGADKNLDKESLLYIKVLVRLVDKSFDEYMMARELILEEIKTGDKLENRFNIIGHLENSINAINRSIKIFDILLNGVKVKNKIIKKNFNILSFASPQILKKVKKHNISNIRNRIEHIDKDIFHNKISGGGVIYKH